MTEPIVMRDAIDALRSMTGHTHDPDVTRRRVIGTVTRRKRQRRQVVVMLLLTFVVLPLGTTAYAAFFGTPEFVRAWLQRDVPAMPSVTPTRRVVVERPLSTGGEGDTAATEINPPEVAPTPNLAIEPSANVEIPLATRGEGKRAPRRIDRGEEPASDAPVIEAATIDPSEALYARAHQLHFVARDPAAALDAWNAYITGAHDTSLLPEAKYNRALCLVRLHRNTEAIDALTPFADGTHGNYRRREATALLEALQR